MNPKVKELLKSVHICQSYRKNKSGTFLWPTVYYLVYLYESYAGVRPNRNIVRQNYQRMAKNTLSLTVC